MLPSLLLLLGSAAGAAPQEAGEAATPAADPVLDTTRAVSVSGVNLDWGMGVLQLAEGTLVPASLPGTTGAELVFVGKGTVRAKPPDATEAGQLELFTGSTELDAELEEAVLVMPSGAARLLARGAGTPAAPDLAKARAVWDRWKGGNYRKLLAVEQTLFAAALGDPWASSAFAAWFRSPRLGELVASVDPSAAEQVTLGQFVPLDLSKHEAKLVRRELHREQRQGRLLGLSVDALGQFDTWMSSSLLRDGEPRPGFEPFEVTHYALDVSLGEPAETLAGKAMLTLRPLAQQVEPRALTLHLNADLVVSAVSVEGEPTRFRRNGEELTIALPERASTAETVKLTVDYSGRLLEEFPGRAFPLRDTISWHPRTEALLPATWDVRLEWPRSLDLVACGERVEEGSIGNRRWERRRLTTPAFAFSFELGSFELMTSTKARVPVRVYFDRPGQSLGKDDKQQIVDTAADALSFFEETFGPYPYGALELVTTRRDYSQSLPGLVSLSDLMMMDLGAWGHLLGLEDRRSVIAHEVAHQWWGHQVGWSGYHDVWLSEGIATFAALAYARARLDMKQIVGPTQGWEWMLGDVLPDGRQVESVGPVVLGPRLFSSKAEDAYDPIVYRKGAIVLDMLTQRFGEETFLQMLRGVVTAARGRAISTGEFLEMLERQSGSDLDAFAERFVYGTGLPEIYYEAAFTHLPDGRWRIGGEARQRVPPRFRYSAVRSGERWDVRRERVAGSAPAFEMVVPLRIPVLMKDAPAPKGDEDANGTLEGRLLVHGDRTPIEMELEHEPREVWLDPDHRVLARFYNARRAPKRVALYEGADLAAAGDERAAEARLRDGLKLPVALDGDGERGERKELDGRIRLQLARLYLDRGDDAAAAEELAQAKDLIGSFSLWRPDLDLLLLRSRVRRGEYAEAARGLSKAVLRRGSIDDTEAYVLLAVAAKHSGRGRDLIEARAVAKERGADLSALD